MLNLQLSVFSLLGEHGINSQVKTKQSKQPIKIGVVAVTDSIS